LKINYVRLLPCGGPRVNLICLVRKLEGDNAELASYRLGGGRPPTDIQRVAFAV